MQQVCPSPSKELEQSLRKAAYEMMSPSRDIGISFEDVSSLFFGQPLLSYPFPVPTAAIKLAPLWSASLIQSLGPASTDGSCFWQLPTVCANPRGCSISGSPVSFHEPNSLATALPLFQKPASDSRAFSEPAASCGIAPKAISGHSSASCQALLWNPWQNISFGLNFQKWSRKRAPQ